MGRRTTIAITEHVPLHFGFGVATHHVDLPQGLHHGGRVCLQECRCGGLVARHLRTTATLCMACIAVIGKTEPTCSKSMLLTLRLCRRFRSCLGAGSPRASHSLPS